jgi:hypothetical protein
MVSSFDIIVYMFLVLNEHILVILLTFILCKSDAWNCECYMFMKGIDSCVVFLVSCYFVCGGIFPVDYSDRLAEFLQFYCGNGIHIHIFPHVLFWYDITALFCCVFCDLLVLLSWIVVELCELVILLQNYVFCFCIHNLIYI